MVIINMQSHYAGQFKAIYNGTPWYGKSICRILEPIDPETAWPRLKQVLDDHHLELLGLLQAAASPRAGKRERLPHRMILDVMQHDLYHLGQIALLKKALKKL